MRPEDMPAAPSSRDSLRICVILLISAFLGARLSNPITHAHMFPCPWWGTMFRAVPVLLIRSRYSCIVDQFSLSPLSLTLGQVFRTSSLTSSVSGAAEAPQFPMTSVVTPCLILLSARGFTRRERSEWLCMSMKPGATARPLTLSLRSARSFLSLPIRAILFPWIPMSALKRLRPVPSITTQFCRRMSNKRARPFGTL